MGRHKKTEAERERDGYPDKRPPRDEHEITIPKRMPSYLTKGQKKYWKQLYPHVVAIGSLTEANVLSFIELCETCYYLESLRYSINQNDPPILFQESKYIDPSGQECHKYTESSLSKLYRSYIKQQRDLMSDFELSGKKKGGSWKIKKPKDEMDDILD